jgi:hypothetical protein
VKETWSGVPLIVATLLKPEMALKSLGKDLEAIFPGRRIGFPSDGQVPDILIVRPDDLKLPQTERVIHGFLN